MSSLSYSSSSNEGQMLLNHYHIRALLDIFDFMRDFAQFGIMKCHRHYGYTIYVPDMMGGFWCEFFLSPETMLHYQLDSNNPDSKFHGLKFSSQIRGLKRDKMEREGHTNKINRRKRNWDLHIQHRGKTISEWDEEKEVFLQFKELYDLFGSDQKIPKDSEVWMKMDFDKSIMELNPFDPRLEKMEDPVSYVPRIDRNDLRQDISFLSQHHLNHESHTHGIRISSSDFVSSLLQLNLTDDSQIVIGIHRSCLVMFCMNKGEQVIHLHGKPCLNNEWLTPKEQDQCGLWDLDLKNSGPPDSKYQCWNDHRLKVRQTYFSRLSNSNRGGIISPISINLCLKYANCVAERVILSFHSEKPENGLAVTFPIPGFGNGSLQRMVFFPPESCSDTPFLNSALEMIPSYLWNCKDLEPTHPCMETNGLCQTIYKEKDTKSGKLFIAKSYQYKPMMK